MTDTLALRRQELLARCAEQRVELALEVQAVRAAQPHSHPLAAGAIALAGARLLANRRVALGAAGAALALVLVRPARLARLARMAASGAALARQGLELVARFRQ